MFLEAYSKALAYETSRRGSAARRPLQAKALEMLKDANKESYLVCAPTGYGKSLISMSVALHEFERGSKVIVAYPLRALIEEQVAKMKEMFEFHGIRGDHVGVRHAGSQESPYLVHPVTLTTVDTLSLTAMGLSPEDVRKVFKASSLGHYIFSWSSVFTSSFIILDEVHLMYDSTKSLSFLRALMDLCGSVGVKVVLMTATLPGRFRGVLPRNTGVVEFSRDADPEFYDERSSKKYRIELMYLKRDDKLSRVRDIIARGGFRRALVLFNTVRDAVEFYKLIDGRKILIHSRYREEDKKAKVEELRRMRSSGESYVVVGTQAVEAGIDISSDLIVTEVAPPISLVQRFGRFLRYDEKEGRAFVWVEEDALDDGSALYTVYDKGLVKRTLDYLSSNSDVNLHISYDDFMNSVYIEEPRVDRRLIRELELLFTDLLQPSKSAMELLLKMEGSFVREGSYFTVLTRNNYEVNVSFEYLERLRERGLCDDCPKSALQALAMSLRGWRFRVHVDYDEEVGLV